MNQFEDLPIGIDLGTTFSCIGVYRNGSVEIIPNEIGERITPSVIIFEDDEEYVGEQIQYVPFPNPKNKVYAVKRIIGRKFKDKEVQDDINRFSYKVENNKGRPQIVINKNKNEERYSPEEISAKVLAKLKESAEIYLQNSIRKVVITVPAYFTESQKRATINAGEIAGLNVIKIINEPTAASLAYGFGNCPNSENKYKNLFNNKILDEEIKKIIVFDLGGGTLDVTLLELEKDNIRIKAHSGIMHLGGEDFDNILLDHCINYFKKKTKIDLNRDEFIKQKFRLKKQCELAKRELTDSNDTEIEIVSIANGKDLFIKIKRVEFERLCNHIFKKCLEPIKEVLETAKEKKENINEIILIGGSTRIPQIKFLIQEFFNGKELNCNLNPDEAVAYGATIEAAMEMGKYEEDITLSDVCPFSLGVAVTEELLLNEYGLLMEKIINKGTNLPYKATRYYTPVVDYQSNVLIQVYEGESKFVNDNYFLGKFYLEKIPYKKKDNILIEIIFDLDENSILTVTAQINENNTSNSITIKNDKGGLSRNEIDDAKKKQKKSGMKNLRDKMEKEKNYKEIIKTLLDKIKNESNETILFNDLQNLYSKIEEFIDFFRKDIENNFTLKEKTYFYLTYLFDAYSRLFNLKLILTKKEKDQIISKIKKYLEIFKKDGLKYYPSLIKIIVNNDNYIFVELCFQILQYYLEKGKELYYNNDKKYAKFYIEEALNIIKKNFLEKKVKNNIDYGLKCTSIMEECTNLINILKAESIQKYCKSFSKNKLIDEKDFTNDEQILHISDKFREGLRYLKDSNSQEQHLLKAIYYANIIKIEYIMLKSDDYETLLKMIDSCIKEKELGKESNSDNGLYWFKEIMKYKKEIEEKQEEFLKNPENKDEEIKKSLENEIKKLNYKFGKGEEEFLYYILNKHKPNGLEGYYSFKDRKDFDNYYNKTNKKIFFNKLTKLYNPQRYIGHKIEERKIHFIMREISKKLNELISNL